MKRILLHLLTLIFIKLPIQLLGIIILLPLSMKYKIGELPVVFKWFDDCRERLLNTKEDKESFCIKNFGEGHCRLVQEYNKSWLKRYIWLAFRNSVNVFQHEVLGIDLSSVPSELTIRYEGESLELVDAYAGPPKEPYAWELTSEVNPFRFKIPLIAYRLRFRIGYKIGDISHVAHMEEIGIPLQWVFSIGIRKL